LGPLLLFKSPHSVWLARVSPTWLPGREVAQMKENNFIVRWLAHKSSAVFYKSRQMAGSEPGLLGARCGPCAWWEGLGRAAAEAGRSAGSVWVWGRTWGPAEAGLMRCRPRRSAAAPLLAALRLTGLMCCLIWRQLHPRAAPGPVRLTGGARSHLHYSSWLFNRDAALQPLCSNITPLKPRKGPSCSFYSKLCRKPTFPAGIWRNKLMNWATQNCLESKKLTSRSKK